MKTLCRAAIVLILSATLAVAQGGAPSGVESGQQLPSLSGVDLAGTPLSLDRWLGAGTVVLALWSVHCLDCIRELDDLRAIRREFPPGELTVVAVNADSGLPVARVAGFLRRYEAARGPLGVEHLLDRDARIVQALGISYVPVLVVADRSGRVTSVLTGYAAEDRARVARALEEGRLGLGAWSQGLRGRLRSVLRSPGPGGEAVEWGSFRVEAGLGLYGVHDAGGWLFDAAGRRDRQREAQRVEAVVADRLKVALLSEALASIGVRLPPPEQHPRRPDGLLVPESPFAGQGRWRRLYEALAFEELYREEETSATWIDDDHRAGLVGDVDLGGLRGRLGQLDYPLDSRPIGLETVTDFDYKARAVLRRVQLRSYRLQAVQGEHLRYYGSAQQLADELRNLTPPSLKIFVEVLSDDSVRLEVY